MLKIKDYISYYELLGMIKERNIPPKIILHLVPNKSVEYISDYDYANSEFIGYEILKDEEADENYSYHLGDCFLESAMFDKVIETIEEEKEIEKINLRYVVCNSDFAHEENGKLHIVELLNNFFRENDEIINKLIDEVKKTKGGKMKKVFSKKKFIEGKRLKEKGIGDWVNLCDGSTKEKDNKTGIDLKVNVDDEGLEDTVDMLREATDLLPNITIRNNEQVYVTINNFNATAKEYYMEDQEE